MNDQHRWAEISLDDFARRFALRAQSLMWFLGAGASASAGIPTASDLIWEFKQKLFISQRRVPRQAVEDLGNPAVREQLQSHIDSLGRLPERDSQDEYAALFESVYPSEADRRTFLASRISGASPSYGHVALGALMRAELTPLVWTTNFDPLVADACARVFGGTGHLTSVDLDRPHLGEEAVSNRRWPVEIKLHGDFRSGRLKNTSDELREQDARLRRLLVDACRRFGLVVIGYSGRDESVMSTLAAALEESTPFPNGFFWLCRESEVPSDPVVQLLSEAAEKGVEAALVRVASFDETLRDIARVCDLSETSRLDEFIPQRSWRSPAPEAGGALGGPSVRLNALEVVEAPTACRRVVCTIGGYSEVHEAVADAGADILVARVRSGVLAFGDDESVRATFEGYSISEFDLYTIDIRRLQYNSGERGLLRDALARAICRTARLDHIRRRSFDLLAPSDCSAGRWSGLRQLVGRLSGHVNDDPELRWREGFATRLDWAADRLWLLVEPRIVFDGLSDTNKAAAASFARERTIRRYNRQLNALISYWTTVIAGAGDLRALGIGAGIDARFRLSTSLPISRRVGA